MGVPTSSSTRAAPNKGLLSGVVGPVESSQELSSDVPNGEEDRKSMLDTGWIRGYCRESAMWDQSFLSSPRRDQVPEDSAVDWHARLCNTIE